ncbi:MAG: sigma-54 dependent transcriptional regulator [Candidatus Polarisedimenticolia bacterium]|nr:sigma-54 dependent transcriptional regulator [bacterium]
MTAEERRGRIVIVDDDAGGRQAMARALERVGFEVAPFADGIEALAFLREHPDTELVLTDLRMPGIDGIEVLRRARELVADIGVLMITAYGSVETAVGAMKFGAEDYLEKPVNLDVLRGRVTTLVEKVRLGREVNEFREVERILVEQGAFEGMVGQTPAMMELFRKIQQVAAARSSVLILGESGAGKELVARAIHRHSPRARQTFLPVDCAAIPAEILESELFGHERGAFTGAQMRKPGKFELATGGTLFLDEIGELPLALQAKLLRALETQTFMRVGGTEEVHVDVRVLAATNRDLGRMADAGEFRQDLYYRLAVVTLRIPSLRERRSDVPLLAASFLERFAKENGRKTPLLTPDALQVLKHAPWPGNVRELRNMMESLVILHPGEEVQAQHLPEELRRAAREEELSAGELALPASSGALVGRTMEEIEREVILKTLERTAGNRTAAAEMLGIGLRTLQRKIKQYREEGYPVMGADIGD